MCLYVSELSDKFPDFRRAYSSEVRRISFSAKLKFGFEVVFFSKQMCKLFFHATNPLILVWILFLFIKMITTFETYTSFEKEKS